MPLLGLQSSVALIWELLNQSGLDWMEEVVVKVTAAVWARLSDRVSIILCVLGSFTLTITIQVLFIHLISTFLGDLLPVRRQYEVAVSNQIQPIANALTDPKTVNTVVKRYGEHIGQRQSDKEDVEECEELNPLLQAQCLYGCKHTLLEAFDVIDRSVNFQIREGVANNFLVVYHSINHVPSVWMNEHNDNCHREHAGQEAEPHDLLCFCNFSCADCLPYECRDRKAYGNRNNIDDVDYRKDDEDCRLIRNTRESTD